MKKIKRSLLTVAAAVLTMLAAFAMPVCAEESDPDDLRIWHRVDMHPGDSYDVSNAKANTTVFISHPGEYYLRGKTTNARVVIESGDVNLFLDDGLSIDATTTSFSGSYSGAINIGLDKEPEGTITITSRKNANIYLEGYEEPAIFKNGIKTKLVFETEDPDHPGTIKAQGGSGGAGIGGESYETGKADSTGNIVFNSGNIEATGGLGAAGIGAGSGADVNGITINGGNIKAYGNGEGAAIGGGACGNASNIFINGGTIHAETDGSFQMSFASAIGGGGNTNQASQWTKNIIITGGSITAKSHTGTGIGAGGVGSTLDGLEISGGYIDSKATFEGGTGIGAGPKAVIKNMVISGGEIYAKGSGSSTPGIGSVDGISFDLTITGGTIRAYGRDTYDIGSGDSNVVITGGCVEAGSIKNPKNKQGQALHRVAAILKDVKKKVPISELTIEGGDYDYSLKDVYSIDNNFFIWLPADPGKKLTRIESYSPDRDMLFYGEVPFTADWGNMHPGTTVELRSEQGSEVYGSAFAIKEDSKLISLDLSKVPKGVWVDGIYDQNNNFVANRNGEFSGAQDVPGIIQGGKWIYEDDLIYLYVKVVPDKYFIRFDGNKPRGASTTLTGSKAAIECYSGTEYNVPVNNPENDGFKLPGYEFKGWKRDPQGKSAEFIIGDKFSDLASYNYETITFYAHWEPKEYTVTLDRGGGGTLTTKSLTLKFDEAYKLPTVESLNWTFSDRKFHGWDGVVGGSHHFYGDGATVRNLCTIDNNGIITPINLEGQWTSTAVITVSVTNDGEAIANLGDYFYFIKEGETGHYTMSSDYANGRYTFGTTSGKYKKDGQEFNNNFPAGKYTLWLDTSGSGNETLKKIPKRSSEEFYYSGSEKIAITFDYYTVKLEYDTTPQGAVNSVGLYKNGQKQNVMEYVPGGTEISVKTEMNPGYSFDGYSVDGIPPEGFVTFDPDKRDQNNLKVIGKATIYAHGASNEYTVKFDKNTDHPVTGSMEDQDMIYEEEQNLFANKFSRIGGIFTGWNTKPDGTGTGFSDGQRVKDLAIEDGAIVTLYAQWQMKEYSLGINLDGGSLPAGTSNPTSYFAYSPTFTLVNPTKADYEFLGWIGTGLKEPQMEVTIPQGSMGDRRYTALWGLKHFYVRFNSGGGSKVDSQRIEIHGKATKPADPTREGYTFTGWFADAALTTPFDFATAIESDITIYAGWNDGPKPQEVIVFEPTSKGKSLTATIGKEYKFVPTEALIGKGSTVVSMTIANPKIATIDPDGTIHLIKKGTTKIQVKITYPKTVTKRVKEKYTDEKGKTKTRYVKQTVTEEKTKTINITLKVKEPVVVKKVGLNKTKVTFDLNKKNKSLTLKASFSPSNAPNKEVRFESLNPDIVSVTQNGNDIRATITALKVGDAKIKVTSLDKNGASKTISVKVVDKGVVSGVKLNKKSASVKMNSKNKTVQLKATVKPSSARNKTVTWESSDPSVATVDNNGKVTALKPGKATITAKSTENATFMASCTITVKEK